MLFLEFHYHVLCFQPSLMFQKWLDSFLGVSIIMFVNLKQGFTYHLCVHCFNNTLCPLEGCLFSVIRFLVEIALRMNAFSYFL